jgi:hypothetical protein
VGVRRKYVLGGLVYIKLLAREHNGKVTLK